MRKPILLISITLMLFSLCVFAAGETDISLAWRNQLLTTLTNPNIAYLLLLIAIYGIFFELANPGLIFPGVTGVISLLLVLYAFQLLPVNYLGVMLILIGIAFMIAEVYVASFGVIGFFGVIAFAAGSILIFNTSDAKYHLALPLIIIMSVISFAFIFMILSLAIQSHKRKIVSGREGLIGSEGVVLSVMNQQTVVRVLGEIWDAKSSDKLQPGDKIKVTHVQGLVLIVKISGE
jgi:membrane-bound serine protease (ClpP class)